MTDFVDSAPVRRSGGFTLLEIMIALVVTGILGVVIFQFIVTQDRFTQAQSGREEVQQNARVAIDVITGELRSTAPEGILTMQPGHVEFEHARVIGILCAPANASEIVVAAASGLDDILILDGQVGLKIEDDNRDWERAGTPTHRISMSTASVNDCDASAYDPDADYGPGVEFLRLRRAGGQPFPFASGAYTPGRSLVVLYETLGYSTAPDDQGVEWISRTRYGSSQALAGPVADGGLVFSYLDANDVVTTDASAVRKIRMDLTTVSRGGTPQAENKRAEVYLRQMEPSPNI